MKINFRLYVVYWVISVLFFVLGILMIDHPTDFLQFWFIGGIFFVDGILAKNNQELKKTLLNLKKLNQELSEFHNSVKNTVN